MQMSTVQNFYDFNLQKLIVQSKMLQKQAAAKSETFYHEFHSWGPNIS